MENPLSQLPIPLLGWYQTHARDLPWRREVTPYRVWVSEIMLQQTRVAAVVGYFTRFLEAFPTVQALAEAPEDQLMKLWQGLGYYSRARNLQKAARQIVDQFGGAFPSTYQDLRSLAGVGEYTAAAIASIAFGQPVPAVDGNLLRVAARVMGDDTDITTTQGKRHFTQALQEVIPTDFPGKFNQAMMDLGAMVCLPNGAPLCEECPAQDFCVARREGTAQTLPIRPAKKPRRVEERAVFLLFHQGKVALRRRPAKGLLAGLWEFPNEVVGSAESAGWGLDLTQAEVCGVGRHVFTHREWHMTGKQLFLANETLPEGWVWADEKAFCETYAVPNAFSAFLPAVEAYFAQWRGGLS